MVRWLESSSSPCPHLAWTHAHANTWQARGQEGESALVSSKKFSSRNYFSSELVTACTGPGENFSKEIVSLGSDRQNGEISLKVIVTGYRQRRNFP